MIMPRYIHMNTRDNPIFEDETDQKPKGSPGYWIALIAVAVAFALAAALLPGALAHAEDIDTAPIPDKYQQEVERTGDEYKKAAKELEKARKAVKENSARIAELEEKLPLQQERCAEATRNQYKLQQKGSGLIELLFSSDDFHSFISSLDYLVRVSEANIDEMNRLSSLKEDLEERQKELVADRYAAKTHAAEAEAALKAAQEARKEAQRRAQEEARRQAEAAARAAQINAEKEAAMAKALDVPDQAAVEQEPQDEDDDGASEQSDDPDGANEEQEEQEEQKEQKEQVVDEDEPAPPTGAPLEAPSDDGADWSQDEAAFVAEWSARIDAFLAGSAMAGQGKAFAKAAWSYGVDPRWSPAIANSESGLGASCFLPYNAWGWGNSSWSSWEEAIDAHVGGLARGYGYTITVEAAQRYCPPNWENWYNNTVTAMNMI